MPLLRYHGDYPPRQCTGPIFLDCTDHPGDRQSIQHQSRPLAPVLGIAATSSFQWVRDLDGLQFGISNAVAVRGTAPRPLIGYRLKVNDMGWDELRPFASSLQLAGYQFSLMHGNN